MGYSLQIMDISGTESFPPISAVLKKCGVFALKSQKKIEFTVDFSYTQTVTGYGLLTVPFRQIIERGTGCFPDYS